MPSRPKSFLASVALAAGTLLAAVGGAAAHPHVFVDARTQVVFDAEGKITAVRQIWRFDDAFSAFASQGLDKNGDGVLSVDELQPLAKVNVDSLKDYDYFTFLRVEGKRSGFKIPTEYWLQSSDGYLTLFYTLNLMQPVKPDAKGVTLDVFDPGYFVDFQFVEKDPVVLEKAPATCKAEIQRKGAPDAATAAILGQIPASERDLPPELKALTSGLANRITVRCP